MFKLSKQTDNGRFVSHVQLTKLLVLLSSLVLQSIATMTFVATIVIYSQLIVQ